MNRKMKGDDVSDEFASLHETDHQFVNRVLKHSNVLPKREEKTVSKRKVKVTYESLLLEMSDEIEVEAELTNEELHIDLENSLDGAVFRIDPIDPQELTLKIKVSPEIKLTARQLFRLKAHLRRHMDAETELWLNCENIVCEGPVCETEVQ